MPDIQPITEEDFGVLELAIRLLTDKIEKNLRHAERDKQSGKRGALEADCITTKQNEQRVRLDRAKAWVRAHKKAESI